MTRKDRGELTAAVAKFLTRLFVAHTLGPWADIVGATGGDTLGAKIKEWFASSEEKERSERLRNIGATVSDALEAWLKAERVRVALPWLQTELSEMFDSLATQEDFERLGPDIPAWQAWFKEHTQDTKKWWSPEERQAFTMARDHAAALTVSLLLKSDDYIAAIVANQSVRVRVLEEQLQEYLRKVGDVERQQVAREEKDYRLALADSLDSMELFGAGLTDSEARYPLMVAYISLSIKKGSTSWSPDAETLFDRLEDSERLLFLEGPAGSGKSTLLKWLAVNAAQKSAPPFELWQADFRKPYDERERAIVDPRDRERLEKRYASLWRFQLPLFLRMRDVMDEGGLPQPATLAKFVAERNGHLNAAWIEEKLEQGECLLLIDGLDEVASVKRPEQLRRLQALVRKYKNNRCIITSRPMPGELNWRASLGFTVCVMESLTERDKSELIAHWYDTMAKKRALFDLRPGELSSDDLRQRGALLEEELPKNQEANQLAANPLLCALICSLFALPLENPSLPETLPELCEAACQMLLDARARQSKLLLPELEPIYKGLPYKAKRKLVQLLAVAMVDSKTDNSSLDFVTAKGILKDKLGETLCPTDADAEAFMRTFILLCGVLELGDGESVSFLHNTLKEYLAAQHFEATPNLKRLTEAPWDSTVQNMALMAAYSDEHGNEILSRLLSPAKPYPKGAEEQAELLFLRCYARAVLPSDENRKQAERLREKYLPPETEQQAEAIRVFGNAVIERLQYDPELSEPIASNCVWALHLIGTPEAKAALTAYAKNEERQEVLKRLAKVYNPLLVTHIANQIVTTKLEYYQLAQDANIKEYCQAIKQKHFEEWIETIDVPKLKSLYLNNTSVSKIEGLENATALQELSLNNTSVSKIEGLKNATALQRLYLNNTLVSKIEGLENATALQELSLDNTSVSKIEGLENATALRRLFLSNTSVSKIEGLENATALLQLALINTSVSKIEGLENATALLYLHLNITSVSKAEADEQRKKLKNLKITGVD